jgi:hypothetical protein
VPRFPSKAPGADAARERLRSARYLLEDVGYAAGQAPLAVGRGLREFWLSLSLTARRRLAAAAATVVVLALAWVALVPALPCSFPGGDACPPDDDAIALVPADALAYVHVNVDASTDQYEQVAAVAGRVPQLTEQVAARLLALVPGPGGRPPDFERQIRPWFGGEAAISIVPAEGQLADEVLLLEAADERGAKRFASSIAAGDVNDSKYRGVAVGVDGRGLATAQVGGFLAIGRESGVRDAIDAETGAGRTRSLSDSSAADEVLDALPDDRFAEAYLSRDGVSQLVAASGGALASLAPFLEPDASDGAGAALVADGDGLRVAIHSALDSDRERSNPGFFSAFPSFSPSLAGDLAPNTLAYVGIGDPAKAFGGLLDQASVLDPGLAAAVGAVIDQVRQEGGVDIQHDLLHALGGEAAISLQPAPRARGKDAPPGVVATAGTPYLQLVANDVDESEARHTLANLEAPIASALNPATGQAPVFSQQKLGDTTAHGLRLSPTVDLTYALLDSTLVIATDPAGVQQVARGRGGLDSTDAYRRATDGLSGSSSLVAFLDLQGLVALGEAQGLAEDPAYATFAPEIRRLEAVGLQVRSGSDAIDTEARLAVSDAGSGDESGVPSPSD